MGHLWDIYQKVKQKKRQEVSLTVSQKGHVIFVAEIFCVVTVENAQLASKGIHVNCHNFASNQYFLILFFNMNSMGHLWDIYLRS